MLTNWIWRLVCSDEFIFYIFVVIFGGVLPVFFLDPGCPQQSRRRWRGYAESRDMSRCCEINGIKALGVEQTAVFSWQETAGFIVLAAVVWVLVV